MSDEFGSLRNEELWEKAGEARPRIAVCGFASAGKSMMVNALFGEHITSVNARAGHTREAQFVEHDLFDLIDTPGIGAAGWDEEFLRRHVLEPADVVIHLINGALGVTDADHELRRLLSGHPGLVTALNKVDLLDEEEREQAIAGVVEAFKLPRRYLYLTSGKERTGLAELAEAVAEILPTAKKTGFVGSLSGKEYTAQRVALARSKVRYYAGAAGVVALTPVPFADIALLAPLQVTMFLHISRIFGHKLTREQAGAVISSLLASLGTRTLGQALASALKSIPLVGTVIGGVVGAAFAAASFQALGEVVILYFKGEQKIAPEDVASHYQELYDKALKEYRGRDFTGERGRYESDPEVRKVMDEREGGGSEG